MEGEIINIGNPDNEASVKELAHKLKEMFVSHPATEHYKKYSEIREISSQEYYGNGYQDTNRRNPSIEKAKKILSWEPEVDLDTALKKTLDYYLDANDFTGKA